MEDLVLVGDIPDRTLSSTSQISANTHAFAMMLGDALEIERAVYVPGNHDHTLWTGYNGAPGITNYSGKDVVRNGNCLDSRAEEILSIFLGYPIGWVWWTLERKDEAEGRVAKLTDPHGEPSSDSLERFRKLFLPHLETHVQDRQLEGRGLPTEELFFVYGETSMRRADLSGYASTIAAAGSSTGQGLTPPATCSRSTRMAKNSSLMFLSQGISKAIASGSATTACFG